MKTFYITTTLPYVNADPHIGHAMEFIRADVIARYKRSIKDTDGENFYDVFFNVGTDEHGQKIYEGAQKENLSIKEYVDKYSERFREFCKIFNISYDAFIRTTDDKHIKAAQKMWSICYAKGDIYKAAQVIKYCVGCELEKTDSELNEDGKCPYHTNRELSVSEEENYFFRFSKYQNALIDLYKNSNNGSGLVKPDFRQNEIRKFVEGGLHDFSVSRLKSKMPWGVALPVGSCDAGDEDKHVMYVWFDALTSYISTLDWGEYEVRRDGDEKENIRNNQQNNFEKFWLQIPFSFGDGLGERSIMTEDKRQVVQYCGKDNNKSQSAIWQAMLLSADIPNTTTININGHIISGGVKMSKSIGNVINPFDVIEKYKAKGTPDAKTGEIKSSGTEYPEEVLRFMMCHEVSTYDDSDITEESIEAAYTAYLQNGIGNQVNRIMKLSSLYLSLDDIKEILEKAEQGKLDIEYIKLLDEFKINEAIHIVTDKIKSLDEYIQSAEPFKLIKSENEEDKNKAKEIIKQSVLSLCGIGHHLYFFMPRTSMDIYAHISQNKMPRKPLFGRVK